jgi:hypothetical protein
MFEDHFQYLRGVFRAALQGVALVIAMVLFCGTLSSAKCPAPADNKLLTLLDWSVGPQRTGTGTTPIRFRRDVQRNHLWIARIASLELRLEWGSGHGSNSWSVTVLDVEGRQVALAVATAETDKCI